MMLFNNHLELNSPSSQQTISLQQNTLTQVLVTISLNAQGQEVNEALVNELLIGLFELTHSNMEE